MTAHLRQLKFHFTLNHTHNMGLVRRSLITNHIRQGLGEKQLGSFRPTFSLEDSISLQHLL